MRVLFYIKAIELTIRTKIRKPEPTHSRITEPDPNLMNLELGLSDKEYNLDPVKADKN